MRAMNLGAHISVAGGLHQAFARGTAAGCNTIQIFSKNERQWRAKPLTDLDIEQFTSEAGRSAIKPVMAHASYLINLASPADELWERSIEALAEELERCRSLGIPYLVLHPGAHTGSGTEAGLQRVAEALDRLFGAGVGGDVTLLLETTAGQGTCLGGSLEELVQLLDLARYPDRIAICADTCHLFAAGYDIATPEGYTATFDRLIELFGIERLKAIHLNDSKGALGSHLDRHEAIGEGQIGLDGFRLLINDTRICGIPMILETPKSKDGQEDIRNLATLRGLRAGAAHNGAADVTVAAAGSGEANAKETSKRL
jgi:deoxyribonuclease IV